MTETGDLSERIEVRGRDELSRLATSFNTMLGALEESTRAQRQLVADASHELRTPLTSLRTNIEVLASGRTLPPGERERLLARRRRAARGDDDAHRRADRARARRAGTDEPAEDVRLDVLAADAVERARRNRPGVEFRPISRRRSSTASAARSSGRSANLLDNAAKWSPPGGEVEVTVRGGEVTVRDHGPGIADEDLPLRLRPLLPGQRRARMPGSGLGLAIVRQVAEAHGGTVVAERAEGGGTTCDCGWTAPANGQWPPRTP